MDKSLVLTPINGEPRIQDLQLAKRLGFDQARDIRKLIKRNEDKLLNFGQCATVARRPENGGTPTNEYYLNQKQAVFICMKSETDNAFEVQAEIVRVFDAHLNGTLQPQHRLPQTYLEALKDLVVAHEELEITRPKAAALDRIATASDGTMCITEAAKHLQMRPVDLTRYLHQSQWIYRRSGNKNWLGYAHILQQGLLEHKVHVSRDDGVDKVNEQVRVTPKGLAKLASLFSSPTQLPHDLNSMFPFGGVQ